MKKDVDDIKLRPQSLTQYIGQTDMKEMLDIYIQATKKRKEPLDHVLLYGAPGLGKTTLAHVIANELGVKLRVASGPAIEKTGDLVAILTSLRPNEVLFIDEIHRLPKVVEEVLYSALEDFFIDIVIGKDAEAKSIIVDLAPFTLVGATTRFGDLTPALRERFGVVFRLDYYQLSEIEAIIRRTASIYKNLIDEDAVSELSLRSRGTPRVANRLFRRVRDFAEILSEGDVTKEIAIKALDKLKIDKNGLNQGDYSYLITLVNKFDGGPVGLETLAGAIGEEITTVLDVYEPYLIQEGYVKRTPRGRVATKLATELIAKSGRYL